MKPQSKNERRELIAEITGFTNQGDGVSRPDGMAVFIPGVFPGEQVRCRILQQKKNYAKAELLEILHPASGRCAAVCPVFSHCGGCLLQEAEYGLQLHLKEDQLRSALVRIGKQDGAAVRPILPSSAQFEYRNRLTFHVRELDGKLRLGFFREHSRDFCPAVGCLLPERPIRQLAQFIDGLPTEALPDLSDVTLRINDRGQLLLILVGRPASVWKETALALREHCPQLISVWACGGTPVYSVYGADWQLLSGTERFPMNIAGVELSLAPASFTQVNTAQTAVMYREIAAAAQLTGKERVLDLYCGAGAISLFLADQAASVDGVEAYAPAAADAAANARANAKENCCFYSGKTEEILPRLVAQGKSWDVAVLDPPRAGSDPAALQALLTAAPDRIVYASCDPATLSRDLRTLTPTYRLQYAQPIDQFAQTSHVETVCLLYNVNNQ